MKSALCLLVLLASAAAQAAEPYGRLFFTPAQRAQLDAARRQNVRISVGPEEETAAPVSQQYTVSGVIRRNDGKATVWVNDRVVDERTPGGVVARPNPRDPARVTLGLPQAGRSVDVGVGQTVESLSGTVEEGYARRPSSLASPKPEAKAPAETDKAAKPAGGSATAGDLPTAARSRGRDREEAEAARLAR